MCFACIPIGGSIVANLMYDTNITNNMTKYASYNYKRQKRNNLDKKSDKYF